MLDKLRNAVLVVVGGLVAVWAVTSLVGVVQGGPMDPPGPPGETTIPLNDIRGSTPLYPEDMPYNLDHSGSYYLTGDWHLADPGTDGITIAADNVTLDLNGFALIGPGKTVGSDDGIHVNCGTEIAPLPCYNISISNGTVRDWGEDGVDGDYGSNAQFANLRLYGNGVNGLLAGLATVTDSMAELNGGVGFLLEHSTVVGSSAVLNGGDGFNGLRVVLTDCFSRENAGDGIEVGISTVSNCLASWNKGNGIEVWTGNLVTGNVAEDNTGAGIHVAYDDNRIEGNNVTNNDIGFDVDSGGNLIIKNSASGNTTASFAFAANNTYGEVTLGAQEPIPDGVSPWANFGY